MLSFYETQGSLWGLFLKERKLEFQVESQKPIADGDGSLCSESKASPAHQGSWTCVYS